jgi:flagellin-like protein
MKANRKFIKGNERAVSAVIGVILMVAITVAIAATVYVYVSGMIGGTQTKAPNMAFNKETTPTKKLTVVSADNGLTWNNYIATFPATITAASLNGVALVSGTAPANTPVAAGDSITITGTGTLTLRYVPTNTLMGTWTWT